MQTFVVDTENAGQRADTFLAAQFPEFSRSAIAKLLKEGEAKVNGEVVKTGYTVKEGDAITVSVDRLLPKSDAAAFTLPILFENNDVIVINKPAGILSHSKGVLLDEHTVATFISEHGEFAEPTNHSGVVHRLDRDTSGVMILAKNDAAASHLRRQFSDKKAKKTYIALTEGVPKEPEAIIKLPIERNPKQPQRFRIGASGKPSETHYKVLEVIADKYALLELKPITGRTHQLRVHLTYLGCPIAGDRFYNPDSVLWKKSFDPSTKLRVAPSKSKSDGLRINRLFLHAVSLEITIPGGERKTFNAPLPEELENLIKTFQSFEVGPRNNENII